MIFIYILLCVFIVTITQTLQVKHQLNTDHIQELFQVSPDKAPDYDVISVDHSLHKENIKELSVKAIINGTQKEFVLQCVEGFFAGKDTKVWLAEKDPLNKNKFKYTPQPNIMENVNISFYQDKKTQSTITQTVNEKGISELNGVLDSDKIIRPLKNMTRKRRDVSSESFDESNDEDLKNYHIIYKRAVLPTDKFQKPNLNNLNRKLSKESSYGKPDIVYPEILVYVDTTLFKFFKKDIVKTVAYTLTLWNGIDLSYRELENPKVRLNIAGIILCQDQIIPMHPFKIYNESMLEKFQQFMYKEDKFKMFDDYDIAVLLASNREPGDGLIGLGPVGGACCISIDEYMESAAIIVDDTNFSGINTGAHELGHLFGALHDGDQALENVDGPGAEDCPEKEGFLMADADDDYININQFYFSPCAKKMMSFFLSQEDANCLRNDPSVNRTDKQMMRILPGKYMSIDEQCQMRGFLKAHEMNPSICLNLNCVERRNSINKDSRKNTTLTIAALEGTSCDPNKFCLRGECVEIRFNDNESEDGSKILFPPDSTTIFNDPALFGITNLPYETTSSEPTTTEKNIVPNENRILKPKHQKLVSANQQCRNAETAEFFNISPFECYLQCKTFNFHEEIWSYYDSNNLIKTIRAPNGFSCIDGYCEDGQCVRKLPNTDSVDRFKLANDECKKKGATGISSKYELFPIDCTFECRKSDSTRQLISAPDGLSCSNNGHCQHGHCVTDEKAASNLFNQNYTTPSNNNNQKTTPFIGDLEIVSADLECHLAGTMGLLEVSSTECHLHCKKHNFTEKLWSLDHSYDLMEIVPAPFGFPCIEGYCKDGKCQIE